MASKEVIFLEPGDEISTVISQSVDESIDGQKTLREYETFTLEEEPVITKGPLPDGMYVVFYLMYDVWGNHTFSAQKGYDLVNGEIVRWEDIPDGGRANR